LDQLANVKNQFSGMSYDAAGNLLNDGSTALTYDAENRVITAAGVTYTYDGDGRRVKKSNGKLYWYGLAGEVLQETTLTNTLLDDYIFFNGKRTARRRKSDGAVFYFFSDHLGSARVVTNASGGIVEESDYYPYGGERVIVNSLDNNYKFTGQERDTESGLDYFGARHFASNLARFLQVDPIVVTPDRLADPQQFNLYGYARNNPLRFIDPTGMDLTVSGDIERAREEICMLAKLDDCSRVEIDPETHLVTINFTEEELAQNEGAAVLNNLITSENVFDFFVGTDVETRGGVFSVTSGQNLDNLPDERYRLGKTELFMPKEGIDSQIAINPYNQRISETALLPATINSIVFHEFAEAYSRVEYRKRYSDAHQDAVERERRLRDQRPYLKEHNFGSGPGDIVIKK